MAAVKRELFKKYSISICLILFYFLILPLSEYTLIEVKVDLSMLREMISIVIGSISSILGIIIAVYILAFSLVERNFSSISNSIFTNSIQLIRYLQLCVITILVMISANFLLDESLSNLGINTLGYGLILYIYSLLQIYPTAKKIINESKSNKPIEELLSKLNEDSARIFISSQDFEKLSMNAFYLLSMLSRNFIVNNEKLIINKILNKCNELIKEKIKTTNITEANQIRGYLNAFVKLFKVIMKDAEDQQQIWILHRLLTIFMEIRKYGVKRKVPYYDFIEYDAMIHDMCIRYIKMSHPELSRSYVHFLSEFMKENIEFNLPAETDLLAFHIHDKETIKKGYDPIKSAQWDYIGRIVFYKINNVAETAIKYRDYEVFSTCEFVYNNMFSYILKSEKLGNKQKRFMISTGSYHFSELLKQSIEETPDQNLLTTYETFMLTGEIDDNGELNIILCNDFISLFPIIAKHKKMNSYIVNEYGTLGRSLSEYISNNENIELIVIKLLQVMVSTSKSMISKIDIYTLTTYIEIYKQVESVIKWTERKNKNKELITKMKNILEEMNEYQNITEMINDEFLYLEMLLEEKK